jgi:uncharacterized membrane protein HdeD (DUF308 family)
VSGRQLHRLLTTGLSGLMVLLGIVALVRTAVAGTSGLALGYLIGVGLIAAGVLRLIVLRRT